MKLPAAIALTAAIILASCSNNNGMNQLINERLDQCAEQYRLMAASLADSLDRLPRDAGPDGTLRATSPSDWVSGFFPGSLWRLYEYNNDPQLFDYAVDYTLRLVDQQHNRGTHDLGFMLYCSFGNGFRLTADTVFRHIMINGAASLASRYNPVVGCIKSWDHNRDQWQYPVIIDNMMNLEFLLWAARETGNQQLYDICISHADKTIEHHFRPDFSSYHVVSFDTISGKVEKKNTHQGYSDHSAWARGQSWGLYGYVTMYRETREPRYLEQAKSVAAFLLSHPNLPPDKIPYWDYNAPDIPGAKRDASAGAIMASALVELSRYVDKKLADQYLAVAERQIRTLSSPEYFAGKGTNANFILKHSVGHLPANSQIDVPLAYADYYYIEAMLRFRETLK
jgi:rhamnogalacturonyl hydrolase YesR